jgi:hypothetical protein
MKQGGWRSFVSGYRPVAGSEHTNDLAGFINVSYGLRRNKTSAFLFVAGNRDGSVAMVAGLWVGRSGIRYSEATGEFPVLQKFQTG